MPSRVASAPHFVPSSSVIRSTASGLEQQDTTNNAHAAQPSFSGSSPPRLPSTTHRSSFDDPAHQFPTANNLSFLTTPNGTHESSYMAAQFSRDVDDDELDFCAEIDRETNTRYGNGRQEHDGDAVGDGNDDYDDDDYDDDDDHDDHNDEEEDGDNVHDDYNGEYYGADGRNGHHVSALNGHHVTASSDQSHSISTSSSDSFEEGEEEILWKPESNDSHGGFSFSSASTFGESYHHLQQQQQQQQQQLNTPTTQTAPSTDVMSTLFGGYNYQPQSPNFAQFVRAADMSDRLSMLPRSDPALDASASERPSFYHPPPATGHDQPSSFWSSVVTSAPHSFFSASAPAGVSPSPSTNGDLSGSALSYSGGSSTAASQWLATSSWGASSTPAPSNSRYCTRLDQTVILLNQL